MTMQAGLLTDGYKLFHKTAYLPGIEEVYANFTSRSGRLSNTLENNGVVFVGLQYFILDVLVKEWNETFFNLPKEQAIPTMSRIINSYLGYEYDISHFEALHDLGYLPLEIKALPEGSVVSYGVAPMTFKSTNKDFEWVSNFIETVTSTENWPIQTSATTAIAYMKRCIKAFMDAGVDTDLCKFMIHDFSFRGMFGRHAAAMSGFGHLASGLVGTDTLPAIMFAEKYYGANVDEELVACSVNATEHSTATSAIISIMEEKGLNVTDAEVEYVRYLFTKAPTGTLSHVSDSFDFFAFVTEGLPKLKDEIMARDGKLVIRPDSGDPVDILCGLEFFDVANSDFTGSYKDLYAAGYKYLNTCGGDRYIEINAEGEVVRESITKAERDGLIETLYGIFGGTKTDKGYILLDDHIGAIYGDSITLARQDEIYNRLMAKGFAPVVVLGVGSYSYQYVTRDTHGSAVKATNIIKDGKDIAVCKDPKTDAKKKSAKGLLRVEKENGTFVQYDEQTREQEAQGELKTVFLDGVITRYTTLAEIRQRVQEQI